MIGMHYKKCLFILVAAVAHIHGNAALPSLMAHERQPNDSWKSEKIPTSTHQLGWADCRLELRPKLQQIPSKMHKAAPKNPPSPSHPLLAVGYHLWIDLECSCCCGQPRAHMLKAISEQLANQSSLEAVGYLAYQLQTNNSKVVSLSPARTQVDCHGGGSVTGSSGSASPNDSRRRRLSAVREATNTRCENNVCRLKLPVECRKQSQQDTKVDGVQGDEEPAGFCISADHLGYANVLARLVWVNASSTVASFDNQTAKREVLSTTETNRTVVLATGFLVSTMMDGDSGTVDNTSAAGLAARMDYVQVTVVLPPQKFYAAADWSTAIITSMIAFSVGCCSDPTLLKAYLRLAKPILSGVICQLIVIPIISLAIGACFSLNTNQAFGLFVTATVPGGGLAFLLTYLAKGDRHMSAAISLVICLSDIAVASIWMLTVGRLWFHRPLHHGIVVGWLAIVPTAQLTGVLVRSYQPSLANGLLTWVTRPLLLLWGILLVTLGVYINHYAYAELNRRLIASLLLLIVTSFTLAWIVNQVLKQTVEKTKAMATEASIFNGLLCMPLLRTSLQSPDGDLAAVVALGATFLALIPLILNAVVTVLHRWLSEYLQRRRKLQEQRHGSLLPGLMSTNSNIGDMCPTSVVAVAAAAIAVAPTITGVRDYGVSHNKTTERHSQSTRNPTGGDHRKVPDSPTEESTHSTVITNEKSGNTDKQMNALAGTMVFTNTSIRNDPETPTRQQTYDDKVSPAIHREDHMDSRMNPTEWSYLKRYQSYARRKNDSVGDCATTKLLSKDAERLSDKQSQLMRRLSGGNNEVNKTSTKLPYSFWYDRPEGSPNKTEEISMMPITTSISHYQIIKDDLGPKTGIPYPAGGAYQTREITQPSGNKCMITYPDAPPYTNL